MLAANQRALNRRHPQLLAALAAVRPQAERFRVTWSSRGGPTLLARVEDGSEVVISEEWRGGGPTAVPSGLHGEDVLCLGFGLGGHIRALLEAVGPSGRVSVVLLQPPALWHALAAVDASDLLEDPRCTLIWGDLPAIARELRRTDRAMVHYHLPSLRGADASLQALVAAIQRVRSERARIALGGGLVTENYRRNLGWVQAATGVDELAGSLTGWPAVVVAAGPSLDKNVNGLRGLQGWVPLLCVDTALRRLADASVRPDLVLTVDPNRASLRHFADAEPGLPLAFLPSAYSGVLASHRGPKLVALPRGDRLATTLQELTGKGVVGVGGTVAYFAIEVARRLGCAPIIFVGLDLALTGGRGHCQGAQTAPAGRPVRRVPAVGGGDVPTSATLDGFRQVIELRIAEDPACAFVDATEGGALIAGTVVCSLAEAKARWCRGLPAAPRIFEGLAAPVSAGAPPRPLLEAWKLASTTPGPTRGSGALRPPDHGATSLTAPANESPGVVARDSPSSVRSHDADANARGMTIARGTNPCPPLPIG